MLSNDHGNPYLVFFQTASQVIEEASRGSKFYAKKQADQMKVSQQAKEMVGSLASFTSAELDSARASADLLIEKLSAGRLLNKV